MFFEAREEFVKKYVILLIVFSFIFLSCSKSNDVNAQSTGNLLYDIFYINAAPSHNYIHVYSKNGITYVVSADKFRIKFLVEKSEKAPYFDKGSCDDKNYYCTEGTVYVNNRNQFCEIWYRLCNPEPY